MSYANRKLQSVLLKLALPFLT